MTPYEITEIINSEIGDEDLEPNLHGCNVREWLVESPYPVQMEVCPWGEPARLSKVWVVWKDKSEKHRGISVVYDVESASFGLASAEGSKPICCWGIYGSFLDAFYAM